MSRQGQCGSGLNGGASDVCSLFIAQSFAYAQASDQSCAVIFADVVSAFASIIRKLVFHGKPDSEEGWLRHLVSCGFDAEAIRDISSCAVSILQWHDAGLDSHTLALVRETHRASWFTIDGVHRLASFVAGTLAGTSLADLIFIVAISRVITKLEERLRELELAHFMPTDESCNYFGLEWGYCAVDGANV